MAAIDLLSVWDFSRPDVSEARFRELAKTASPDDTAILQTQIARTYGLRRDFDQARAQLARLQPELADRSPEVRVRYHLELGRTLVSATHRPAQLTPEARASARLAYIEAYELARANGLDDLAIDALHMLAFVEQDKEAGLSWSRQALDLTLRSAQPQARRWEAALRNNVGQSLRELGRYDEALAVFESNLPVIERAGDAGKLRIGSWMVARTLRDLGRVDEALVIQLRLERENQAAGTPDEYVFEELSKLYELGGDTVKSRHYASLLATQKAAAPR